MSAALSSLPNFTDLDLQQLFESVQAEIRNRELNAGQRVIADFVSKFQEIFKKESWHEVEPLSNRLKYEPDQVRKAVLKSLATDLRVNMKRYMQPRLGSLDPHFQFTAIQAMCKLLGNSGLLDEMVAEFVAEYKNPGYMGFSVEGLVCMLKNDPDNKNIRMIDARSRALKVAMDKQDNKAFSDLLATGPVYFLCYRTTHITSSMERDEYAEIRTKFIEKFHECCRTGDKGLVYLFLSNTPKEIPTDAVAIFKPVAANVVGLLAPHLKECKITEAMKAEIFQGVQT